MTFEEVIWQGIASIKNTIHFSIQRNKKRGQSDTFIIFDSKNHPIFIAKFFDYLSEVKSEITSEIINNYNNLDELLNHIDELDNIAWKIDEIVSKARRILS